MGWKPTLSSALRSLAAALALLTLDVQAQDDTMRNPVLVPGAPWAFDGFRVNVPNEEGWYSVARDAHYADLAKTYPNGEEVAAVVEAKPLDTPITGEQALLDIVKAQQTELPDPANMKILDYKAEAFAPKGVLCVRFDAKVDDRRPTFAAPGIMLVRGVGCVRPDDPSVLVSLSYAQRSVDAELAPATTTLLDPFLDSLRFVASSTSVVQRARVAVRSETPGDAVAMLTPIAEEGDGEAAEFLGNIYLYGRGVPNDYAAARKWLELAAKQGRAEAQFNLGAIYDKGLGTQHDAAEAAKWFTLAADQRDAKAQLNIGLYYLTGDGVEKDVAMAERWFKRAANNGDKRARAILSAGKYKER